MWFSATVKIQGPLNFQLIPVTPHLLQAHHGSIHAVCIEVCNWMLPIPFTAHRFSVKLKLYQIPFSKTSPLRCKGTHRYEVNTAAATFWFYLWWFCGNVSESCGLNFSDKDYLQVTDEFKGDVYANFKVDIISIRLYRGSFAWLQFKIIFTNFILHISATHEFIHSLKQVPVASLPLHFNPSVF